MLTELIRPWFFSGTHSRNGEKLRYFGIESYEEGCWWITDLSPLKKLKDV
jgi:hypothetical protein